MNDPIVQEIRIYWTLFSRNARGTDDSGEYDQNLFMEFIVYYYSYILTLLFSGCYY